MTLSKVTDLPSENLQDSSIQCAILDKSQVVIRIIGAGSHQNSLPLRELAKHLQKEGEEPSRFIFDLRECTKMDSTFMGTLAQITTHQMRRDLGQVVICNVNKHNRCLLKTIGLDHILDIRSSAPEDMDAKTSFQAIPSAEYSKTERVIHMIQAHEKLVEVDSENEIRFCNVLKYLRSSQDEEE